MSQTDATKVKQLENQVAKQDSLLSDLKKKMAKQEESISKWLD